MEKSWTINTSQEGLLGTPNTNHCFSFSRVIFSNNFSSSYHLSLTKYSICNKVKWSTQRKTASVNKECWTKRTSSMICWSLYWPEETNICYYQMYVLSFFYYNFQDAWCFRGGGSSSWYQTSWWLTAKNEFTKYTHHRSAVSTQKYLVLRQKLVLGMCGP